MSSCALLNSETYVKLRLSWKFNPNSTTRVIIPRCEFLLQAEDGEMTRGGRNFVIEGRKSG